MKAKSDIADTVFDIVSYYVENEIPIEEQFDFIVVNNRGVIANYKSSKSNPHHYAGKTEKEGYWFERYDEMTIGAFLFYLNMVPPAVMRMYTPVMERYLGTLLPAMSIGKKGQFQPFGKFADLKSRCAEINPKANLNDSADESEN